MLTISSSPLVLIFHQHRRQTTRALTLVVLGITLEVPLLHTLVVPLLPTLVVLHLHTLPLMTTRVKTTWGRPWSSPLLP